MAYVRIRPRRSTAEEWEYNNPILAEGEMGVEVPATGVGTGTVKIKFGDGVTAWKDLPYGINLDDFQPNTDGDDSGDDNTEKPSGPIIGNGDIVLDENDKIETDEIPTEDVEDDETDPVLPPEEPNPETGGDDTNGEEGIV